jgi:hypothetical protein
MKSLRKNPTFNEMIYDLQHQPIIKYPQRKGLNILDDMMISNLLFDDKPIEEWEEIMISDKATQTPSQKGVQTDIFEKEVQTPDFRPKLDYEINPDKYYKIPAFSKYMPNTKYEDKDDATSKTIETKNRELNDNENQTSTYIGSWKKKSDNINQTVRYMLKSFESPIQTPRPTPIPSANPTPTQEEIPTYDPEPGWLSWLFPVIPLPSDIGSDPRPPSKPSVPSASIRSPTASPPASSSPSIPPYPPFSPSPVAYLLSEDEVESQNRSRSSKSSKNKK